MRVSLIVVLAAAAVQTATAIDRRLPVSEDWWNVYFLIEKEINDSTCRKEVGHWDYPPTYGEELNSHGKDDCEWFPEERNPRPLGSRLIRMAFHDAMGWSDGFVDLSQKDHDGLESAVAVLDRVYTDHGMGEYLSKADFYAWSYHAALLYACKLQRGPGTNGIFHAPDIPVRYGRTVRDVC